MATTTQKATGNGSKTPKAVQAQGSKAIPVQVPQGEAVKPVIKALPVPHIKASAISKDVGPAAVAVLARTTRDIAQAEQVKAQATQKNYETLAIMTKAIEKAARADKSIDLSVTFGDDKARKAHLNDQVCIALGVKEIVTVKGVERVNWSKSVAQYFPQKGDDKDSEEGRRKSTFRGNFVTTLTKVIGVAAHIVEADVKAEMDKKAGTLRLSGPAVKKQFGQPSVLLNEKQSVSVAGKEVSLTERPSFNAIRNKAAESHGRVVHRATGSRENKPIGDPAEAIKSMSATFVKAIERLPDELTEDMRKALESVQSAIETRLA